MAANCNRKNPLTRGGTSQAERLIPALSPGYFRLDERDPGDLILFAERFSRLMRYHDAAGTPGMDWLPFFSTDIAATLAGLSELPVASIQEFARALQVYLAEDPARAIGDLRAHFRLVFYLPLLLLRDAGRYFNRLPREHPLRAFMVSLLGRDARSPFGDLAAYYRGALALAAPLFTDTAPDSNDYNTTFNDADPRIQLPTTVTERIAGAPVLSDLDISGDLIADFAGSGWTVFYNTQAAVTAPYEDALASSTQVVYHQIYDALNYNLLDKALERLFQIAERIAAEAAGYLQASLTSFDGHTPHYALWLAFLRLFKFNQDSLNTLTARHLDYYYREVLQLCPRGLQGDQAHLLFELNKGVQEHLLPAASTLFRGGKDASGKEVLYRLDSDIVVNRAKVEALKAVARLTWTSGTAEFYLPYASPVVNSGDGQGAPLAKDDAKWKPFGPVVAKPNTRLGFAVADRQLFLREGTRTITVQLVLEAGLLTNLFPLGFKAYLTGEKGWVEVQGAGNLLVRHETRGPVFEIKLTGDDPPIVPYDPSIHGEGYDVATPVLKVEFDFTGQPFWSTFLYQTLRDARITGIELSVSVSGARDFTLQNETGAIDPSKPFLPFGPSPATNSPLILGSSEVFSKKLASLELHIDWEKALTSTGFFLKKGSSDYKLRLRSLEKGIWGNPSNEYNIGLFGNPITLSGLPAPDPGLIQTLKDEPYSSKSSTGFAKLELNQGFGHGAYLNEKTKALIDLVKDTTWTPSTGAYNYDAQNVPLEPYTLKSTAMTLSYQTSAAAPAHFLHLYPFGWREVSASGGRLLPELANEGELYIGVRDLLPPQRLTLLFRAVDGTANPLKGTAALQWDYLRGDEWVRLEEQFVDDKTNNLTGSGIVGIAVPADADTTHTLLPAGLHWIRMSAARDADALDDLLGIDAQTGTVSFVDQGNDPAFLATPLPAGTIAKLKTGDPNVKKIVQPAASFGGAAPEAAGHFYVRASERLRHKDRGVTMWDYEHLVLEHFPNVWKVKCINHTALERDNGQAIVADNEVRPGHVLVVTIPNLHDHPNADPRRPYTDKRTIVAIDAFLRQRLSPFVRLEVANPKIEEVQVNFKVAFTEKIADIAFYKSELNDAIIRFLCPWAYGETSGATSGSSRGIEFGGKWHKSSIINFIEEQPYVDFVQDFEMYHKVDIEQSDTTWNRIDEEVVEASTARSILVSHKAHLIAEIV